MTTSAAQPKVFGAGLVALDLVLGLDPQSSVRSWTGGTCGNVLSILAYLGWDAYPIARMNGDAASERVRADLARWGVRLDFANCAPTTNTPIIIQEIRQGKDGRPHHRFSWSCPQCGQWLPAFKAVTMGAVDLIRPALKGASVFFLDRLSRATLTLAAEANAQGALVVYEPSGKATDAMFSEAVRLAHVVKYAADRLAGIDETLWAGSATLVEVQTLGEKGLRYRHRFTGTVSEWLHMNAIAAPRLSDTCGSGDWCTAGLIAKAAVGGQAGLRQAGMEGLHVALRYGQALAAWNCGFEGARGGMYAVTHGEFEEQIVALLAGQITKLTAISSDAETGGPFGCPSCPPKHPTRRATGSRRKKAA